METKGNQVDVYAHLKNIFKLTNMVNETFIPISICMLNKYISEELC